MIFSIYKNDQIYISTIFSHIFQGYQFINCKSKMRTLVIICSLAVVCMALPSEEMMSRIAEKTVHMSVQMIRKRDVEKRDVSAGVRLAFSWIDSNKDGHITADEFATFYANFMPQLTREQWRRAFQAILPTFDANNNGTLEIDEFAAIAAAGGAGK